MSDIPQNKNKEEEKKEEASFAERLNIQLIRKKCVCGKSKKYPLCDGSHNVA